MFKFYDHSEPGNAPFTFLEADFISTHMMPDGIDFHGRESNAGRYAHSILHATQ